MAIWHEHRSMMKCSIPVCDKTFPLTWSIATPDRVGDYRAELRMFNAVTGLDWTLQDMHLAAERCWNVLRALHIRQDRSRQTDESVIPYFEKQPSYYADEVQQLDPVEFRSMLDR